MTKKPDTVCPECGKFEGLVVEHSVYYTLHKNGKPKQMVGKPWRELYHIAYCTLCEWEAKSEDLMGGDGQA